MTFLECEWKEIQAVAKLIQKGQRRKVTSEQKQYLAQAEKYVQYLDQCYVRPFENLKFVSESSMVESILQDKIYGFVLCDIACPAESREKFSIYPPVFKKVKVGIEVRHYSMLLKIFS